MAHCDCLFASEKYSYSLSFLGLYDSDTGQISMTSQHNDLPLCRGTSVRLCDII